MFGPLFDKLDKYFWEDLKVPNRMNESHLVSHKVLFGIRAILAIYSTVVVTIQTIKIPNIGAFVEFLTFWGALNVQWYFLFTMIEMITFRINKKPSYYVKIWKFTHLMFEFAFCTQPLIVLVFWGFIVPQLGDISQFGGLNIIFNSQLHGGFFLAIIIDFVINNIQFYKRHMLVIYFLTFVYGLINMGYSLIWSPVYPGITWKNWQTYFIFGIGLVLFFLLSLLAQFIFKKWKVKNIEKLKESYICQDYYF
ncbi:hypothetical protein ABPG73_022579 [Tetrahymena malaccensis]